MNSQNHGGARKNAGRRTELVGDPMRRIQVTVDEKTLEFLQILGEGNLSKGVRNAARVAYDRYQRTFS